MDDFDALQWLAFAVRAEYRSLGTYSEEALAMKRLICTIALLALMSCLTARPAAAQASNPFVGQIQTFAFNFCPNGWLPLNGQLLQISQYDVLFNLLGTTYGGDGITTFALPKWGPFYTANGATLLTCISLFGVFPSQS